VGVGSRDEPEATAGTSHFLEHLLFKGTAERDARSIARQIDAVGGEMNAFTASEHTAFYAHVPADALEMATEVLLDVVERPALAAAEVDAEREVILEELAAADDDPDDVVAVGLFESLFPDHPLGRETLGTPGSIAALAREDIAEFFRCWYQPANLVVAAAGDLEHDRVVDLVAARFDGRPAGMHPRRTPPATGVVDRIELRRPVEQAHLALGWRSPSINDDDRFPLALLNHVFGGGPSSRLFQEIRESRGLTYAVGSEVSHYTDSGALSVHCTTTPQKVAQMMQLLDAIVDELVVEGVPEDDVERVKGALRGGLVMTYESTVARMSRLGAAETLRGEVIPIAEHLERLDTVSADQVHRVAQEVLGGRRALAVVAPEGIDLGV
jgi:predicted Zn-dependent peptidase